MNILFLNHKVENCGVYQYGLRVINILKKSIKNNYNYYEIDNLNEYKTIIYNFKPQAIIYNFHSATMGWLNSNNIQKNILNIGIPHESETNFFDYIFSIDPDEIEINNVFSIPRPIYENIQDIFNNYKIKNDSIENFINYNEGPEIPIFGSFGFGFQNKGFDKIIDIINQNYEKAIIKLVITSAHFDPDKDINYKIINDLCNSKNYNPNIKLLIYNKFLTNEEVLLFLYSNSANIFLYDIMNGRGISSVIDYAISVNKPILISDSYMFRHIYSDDICLYKTNIKDAIENSNRILPGLLIKYSNINLINKIDNIIDNKINIIEENKIFGYKFTAYYHCNNNTKDGNVTEKVNKLFNNYINYNQDKLIVCNDLFFDSCVNQFKYLFININITYDSIIELKINENSELIWNNILNEINNHKNQISIKQDNINNIIEVSIGEITDKYSILELKTKYILDDNKLKEIQKEINILEEFVSKIKYSYFYKLLLYINEQIWIDTDVIKTLSINNKEYNNIYLFAEISNRIFENNQRRFRLKNYFNIIDNSNIKEQKSYTENNCYLEINSELEIYNKIPEINYLCISFDTIYIDSTYQPSISNIFKNPNIIFINSETQSYNITNNINIESYTIKNSIRENYEFIPIIYLATGKLGDFLNQLSVVAENYYESGRKGILYICETSEFHDSNFTFGLEKTYQDTYNVIKNLNYIYDYKLYNNEEYDINLSKWRHNMNITNWYEIYKSNYNIEWGKNKWLNGSYDSKWSNKIIINVTPYRFLSENCILRLKEIINNNNINDFIFISNEKEHYDYFILNLNIKIEYYQPNNFDEIVTIINSCKIGFLGYSSMAVIANALHKNHIIIGQFNADFILNNLKGICPHVIDILV
jgi:hypothetical protein